MDDSGENETHNGLINMFKKKTANNVILKEHKSMPGSMLRLAGDAARKNSNNNQRRMLQELFGSEESADTSENGGDDVDMEGDDEDVEETMRREFGPHTDRFNGSAFYPGSRTNGTREDVVNNANSMAEEVDEDEENLLRRGKRKPPKDVPEKPEQSAVPNLMQQQRRVSFSDVRRHVVFGTPLNSKPKNQLIADDSFTIPNKNSNSRLSDILMPPPPPQPQQQTQQSSKETIPEIIGSFAKQISEARPKFKEEKSQCWMCAFASRKEGSVKKGPLDIFFDIFAQCYKRGTNEEVSRIMANYYYEKIYKVLLKKRGKRVPMLTAEDIQRHIELHMLDSRVFLGETLSDFNLIRYIIKQNVFQKKESVGGAGNEDELPETDNRNVKAFAEISKLMLAFYKEDPSKWKIFNNEEFEFNLQNRSGLVNALKNTKE